MVEEIVDTVYDITCDQADGKRYRVFLFDTEVPTLIDAGLESTVESVFDGINEVGVEPERLIITHGDGDHIGGFEAIADRYDVETWLPEQTETDLVADHRYGDGGVVGQFEAVHLPGHTPDNHALIDENLGVAVMGDAVSGADQRGLPAGYFHLSPEIYTEDLNEAEQSLEKLLDHDFDIGLVFHGSSVTENAREKMKRYVNFPGK